MALFKFIKTPKNQRYHYIPRFWDPEEDEKKERLKYLDSLKDQDDVEAVKARLGKGSFRRGFATDGTYRRQQTRKSNKVLILTVIVLIVLTYLLLAVYLPEIISRLE